LEEGEERPVLVNSEGTGSVQHGDITGTYQLTGHWSIGATVEAFQYDKNYRETFGVIPVEERIRLMADYEGHGWDINTTATWIGWRNYADYTEAGYNEHYYDNQQQQSKGDHSPAYFTVDFKASKAINKTWKAYVGINNLFDYTQTGEGDSPLFYDSEGGVDVTHIWGPLRGRFVYAGINAKF
jgi:outer membrane receptor for ferrienterochelin and colicin